MLGNAIRGYLSYSSVERGLSKNTIAAYGTDLKQLAGFCQDKSLSNWSDISRDDILDFLDGRLDQHQEASTIARKWSASRCSFDGCTMSD